MGFYIKENNGYTSYSVLQQQLRDSLLRNQLYDKDGYSIGFGHIGMISCDILVTTWETTEIPKQWVDYSKYYKLIIVGSKWNYEIFRKSGISNVICIHFGLDPKYFAVHSQPKVVTNKILFFANNQHRKGLDILLSTWYAFGGNKNFELIVVGRNIILPIKNHSNYIETTSDLFRVISDENRRVTYMIPLARLSTDELIKLYQSVQVVILPSRSEGFGLVPLEAICCGTLCIVPDYSATAEFDFFQIINFTGSLCKDTGSELGFGYNGCWWEPDRDSLLKAINSAFSLANDSHLVDQDRRTLQNVYSWDNFCKELSEHASKDIFRKYFMESSNTKTLLTMVIFYEKICFKLKRFWFPILRKLS